VPGRGIEPERKRAGIALTFSEENDSDDVKPAMGVCEYEVLIAISYRVNGVRHAEP
jgi:hypothetical protein